MLNDEAMVSRITEWLSRALAMLSWSSKSKEILNWRGGVRCNAIYYYSPVLLGILRAHCLPITHNSKWIWLFSVLYSVFHVIVLQEQGCCELILGLIVSPKASMWPRDWAEISFRSETLWNWFYSEPERWFSKGRISGSVKSSSIYRMFNVQDFFFL